jgi:hypothetical protein
MLLLVCIHRWTVPRVTERGQRHCHPPLLGERRPLAFLLQINRCLTPLTLPPCCRTCHRPPLTSRSDHRCQNATARLDSIASLPSGHSSELSPPLPCSAHSLRLTHTHADDNEPLESLCRRSSSHRRPSVGRCARALALCRGHRPAKPTGPRASPVGLMYPAMRAGR